MAKPVTIKDVAAALGVSTATVSRALKGDPAISAARTAAVVEATRRLNYRPSSAARALRTKSSTLIGVVLQSVGDSYVGEVVFGIQDRARAFGFQPLFFMSEGREDLEAEALEVFRSEQVKEFIAVSPKGSPQLLRRAVEDGLHVSVINWDVEAPDRLFESLQHGTPEKRIAHFGSSAGENTMYHIQFDDVGAGMLATRHLLEMGHRRFVHLRGPNVRSSLLRLLGFRNALEAVSLWPQPVLTAQPSDPHGRELAVAAFLREARPPLAVVAYDDLAAFETLRAADRAGWRVPSDLSVVGIDDIQFSAYTKPTLTSVAQPKRELGALAVETLLSGDPDATRILSLSGSLIVRESTAPISASGAGATLQARER